MATQPKSTTPEIRGPYDSRVEGAFGLFVGDVSGEEQLAFHKELVNKLSWALGSAYKRRYSGKNTDVTLYVQRIVKTILQHHGYKT